MNTTAYPRRVIVGVDGSPNSVAALHRAVAEARRGGTVLEIVLVIPGCPDPAAYAAALTKLSDILTLEYPGGPGVPVREKVEHGDPATTLVELADGAALLVIGARSRSEDGHPLGGEVVPVCLNRAPCPLAICTDHSQHAGV
jgi:nucleotide-binding universal stress UspA family protein